MRRCRGFSLTELLITVGVLAILGVIAMPAFSALMQTYRLNAATLQLAGQLRYAQSLAVSNGASHRFHWGNDPAVNKPNTYRIEKSPWPAVTDTPSSPPNSTAITDWMNVGTSYPGMTFTVKDGTDTTPTCYCVVFDWRGSISLTSPVTLTVSSTDGTTKTIQVRRTGSVKVL